MAKKGELLDRRDAERYKHLAHSDLAELPLGEAAPQLLGDSVTALTRTMRSTLFEGRNLERPADALPFLCYYPLLVFEICPNCPQVRDSSTLAGLLEARSAAVILNARAAKMPQEFQDVLWRNEDLVVGFRSFDLLRHAKMCQDVHAVEGGTGVSICNDCRPRVEAALLREERSMPRSNFLWLEQAIAAAAGTPGDIAHHLLSRLETAVQDKRFEDLPDLARCAWFARYAGSCRSLNSIPQVGAAGTDRTRLLTSALKLDVPSGLTPREYIDIIKPHRGAFANLPLPVNDDSILDAADAINSQVLEIQSSTKLEVGRYLAGSVAPGLASAGLAFATHGVLSHQAATAVRAVFGGRRAESPTGVQFLSKFFGVDESIIHTWQIQEQLAKRGNA